PGDAGVAVQSRRQVRRGRGSDRPGPGRCRSGARPGSPAGGDRPGRAARPPLSPNRTRRPGRLWLLVARIGTSMASLGQILIETITHPEPAIRDRSIRDLAATASLAEKLLACEELERFRRERSNLYERVRASLFLHALYRYDIQEAPQLP